MIRHGQHVMEMQREALSNAQGLRAASSLLPVAARLLLVLARQSDGKGDRDFSRESNRPRARF